MEISFTQFRVYQECPWKYKLLFMDGRRISLHPASSLGLSLHRALERFHRGQGGELSGLLECYEEAWIPAGYPDAETSRQWREKGRRILAKYFEGEASRRTMVVGVEKEFAYPLGRHMVRGMVDRVDLHPDGRHEVIDYKTRLEFEKKSPIPEELQLRFYALGLRECLAIEPALLTVHYLAAARRQTSAYEASGEEALKALILQTADAIEARDFKPKTSFCPHCDFRGDCVFSVAR